MSEPDVTALLGFFKALANESRLRIVGLLAGHERSVQELAELLDLTEPTVSHHLALLKRLGLVTARVDGVTHWHTLQPDGTFSRLPASRRKRWVLLKWLAEQFDPDRRYKESEINEVLQHRHWDSATMRREMVGYRMLARESGVYWRLPMDGWQTVS